MQQNVKTLVKVAKALNTAHIPWALGGSGALYLLGLTEGFRDVDLMVAKTHVAAAEQVIAALDGLEQTGYVEAYDLLQYRIDGLDFDVMKGFRFGDYDYALQAEDIWTKIMVENTPIPIHSPRIWQQFYRLMGRTERVRMINTYIQQNALG